MIEGSSGSLGEVTPFVLRVDEEVLDDLRRRLTAARFPDPDPSAVDPNADWSSGVPLAYVVELCRWWRDEYDWRRLEAELNAIGQWTTRIDGVDVHFLHARSDRPDARPLVLTHGWPGSVVEYLDVIEGLTSPPSRDDPAFHVVVPSLPGFGLGPAPLDDGWDPGRIADAWAVLMARLGYDRFLAQGGDWGSEVTAMLAARHPERTTAIHMTFPQAQEGDETGLDPVETAWVTSTRTFWTERTAYARVQATSPQTIGYALVDSPVALLAWIVEKFGEWTDTRFRPEERISRERILDDVMLHWIGASGASAARIYRAAYGRLEKERLIDVPTAVSVFPAEIEKLPRSWVERRFRRLMYWNVLDEGGHFPSLEVPARFVDEVRGAFRLF